MLVLPLPLQPSTLVILLKAVSYSFIFFPGWPPVLHIFPRASSCSLHFYHGHHPFTLTFPRRVSYFFSQFCLLLLYFFSMGDSCSFSFISGQLPVYDVINCYSAVRKQTNTCELAKPDMLSECIPYISNRNKQANITTDCRLQQLQTVI